jgi:protein-L-isoaspartate(D-aspartate) O-methyltransferase
VLFGAAESVEWLDLWLTCALDNALSRMPADRTAINSGLVTPQFGWGAMATAEHSDLAYLTLRRAEHPGDAGRNYEVGVIGHGPGRDELTKRITEEIRTWDQHHRSQAVHFEIQPADQIAQEPLRQIPGRYTIDRPRTRLIITWQ